MKTIWIVVIAIAAIGIGVGVGAIVFRKSEKDTGPSGSGSIDNGFAGTFDGTEAQTTV